MGESPREILTLGLMSPSTPSSSFHIKVGNSNSVLVVSIKVGVQCTMSMMKVVISSDYFVSKSLNQSCSNFSFMMHFKYAPEQRGKVNRRNSL